MILGLTGSIGSGKTFVSEQFARLGAAVICADALAREVIEPGTPALKEIIAEFGLEVVTDAGELDRRKMASVVFGSPEKRKKLERIIHPRVRQRELELIAEHRDQSLIILEIPLLFESGADDLCDKVLVVTVDDEVRAERLAENRGMTRDEVESRLAAQMPEAEKVERADFVIDNSGTRQETVLQVESLHRQLVPPA